MDKIWIILCTEKLPRIVPNWKKAREYGGGATQRDWSRKVVMYDAWPIRVDYFSLDVEGAELDVLRTLPWDKVDIRYKHIFVSATLPVILSGNSCLRMCCNGDLGPYSYSMLGKNTRSFVTAYCEAPN